MKFIQIPIIKNKKINFFFVKLKSYMVILGQGFPTGAPQDGLRGTAEDRLFW